MNCRVALSGGIECEDMPTEKENLKDRLSRYRQINLSVIGRKSGKTISNPVWFIAEGNTSFAGYPSCHVWHRPLCCREIWNATELSNEGSRPAG
jgi:hypothetical protein